MEMASIVGPMVGRRLQERFFKLKEDFVQCLPLNPQTIPYPLITDL